MQTNENHEANTFFGNIFNVRNLQRSAAQSVGGFWSGGAERVLNLLLLPLILFSPFVRIAGLPFRIDFSDILLLFVAFAIVKNGWWRKYLKIITIFSAIALYILFTIFINGLYTTANCYFEIYKYLKLIIFYIFFSEMNREVDIMPVVNVCFIAIFLFNILHFFNIFDFNSVVMPYYCGDDSTQLQYFGYDSIGRPATRRALGVMGNPNNNALLFLFFLIMYAPRKDWKKSYIILFFTALIAFLCCQSRTGLVAFSAILIANYLFSGIPVKRILVQLSVIICFSLFVFNFSDIMLFLHISPPVRPMNYSLSLLDGSALKSHSWSERIQIWKQLLLMVKDHPLFGYGPNKNFFYENNLFSENEYILMLWRYGIVGLMAYLSLYLYPIFRAFKKLKENVAARQTFMIAVAFMTAALTNNPISSVKLALILMLVYSFDKSKISSSDIKQTL